MAKAVFISQCPFGTVSVSSVIIGGPPCDLAASGQVQRSSSNRKAKRKSSLSISFFIRKGSCGVLSAVEQNDGSRDRPLILLLGCCRGGFGDLLDYDKGNVVIRRRRARKSRESGLDLVANAGGGSRNVRLYVLRQALHAKLFFLYIICLGDTIRLDDEGIAAPQATKPGFVITVFH